MRKPRVHLGFTLLEVLIALLVVSIAMAAVLKAIRSQVFVTERVEHSNIARWVGMNVIAQMQSGILSEPSEPKEGEAVVFGKTWYWKSEPRESGAARILQIVVSVGLDKRKLDHTTVLGFVQNE